MRGPRRDANYGVDRGLVNFRWKIPHVGQPAGRADLANYFDGESAIGWIRIVEGPDQNRDCSPIVPQGPEGPREKGRLAITCCAASIRRRIATLP